jgi:hypothetical protein
MHAREGITTNPAYVNSPMPIVDETNRPFHRRLNQPAPELPLLDELREQEQPTTFSSRCPSPTGSARPRSPSRPPQWMASVPPISAIWRSRRLC